MGTFVPKSLSAHESAPERSPCRVSVRRAIESNLADYWLSLGTTPNGSVHVSDELSWEYSGGPYFNRVVDAHLTQDSVDQRIDEIKRTFIDRKAAITWLLGPSVSPGDLGEHLVNQGFARQEPWIGMARSLEDLPDRPLPLGEHVDVRVVRTDSDYADWIDVVGRSFKFPAQARRLLLHSVRSPRDKTNSDAWVHSLVYCDGKPAAASTLFVKDGVAGIYLVSTLPEMRGLGLGALATWTSLRLARDMGCSLAVLQSTLRARRMYERLGFQSHCEIGVYRFDAPSPTWKRVARSGLRRLRRTLKNVTSTSPHASNPERSGMADRLRGPTHLH
jgi:GNAT superfamily N-acetyltransferase